MAAAGLAGLAEAGWVAVSAVEGLEAAGLAAAGSAAAVAVEVWAEVAPAEAVRVVVAAMEKAMAVMTAEEAEKAGKSLLSRQY